MGMNMFGKGHVWASRYTLRPPGRGRASPVLEDSHNHFDTAT